MSAEITLPVAQQNRNIVYLATAGAGGSELGGVLRHRGDRGERDCAESHAGDAADHHFVLGMAACILPFGALARRRGRKTVFMTGTGAGILTGLLAALAVVIGSFWLFCIAAFLGGAYAAVSVSFRFAATDGVSRERRARALSLVMGGGVAAGVIGPMLVTGTMNLWPPHTFAMTFIAQALVAVVSALVLLGVKTAEPVAQAKSGGRPLGRIVRQPGPPYGVQRRNLLYGDELPDDRRAAFYAYARYLAAGVKSRDSKWHVIAMFGPGFFHR